MVQIKKLGRVKRGKPVQKEKEADEMLLLGDEQAKQNTKTGCKAKEDAGEERGGMERE